MKYIKDFPSNFDEIYRQTDGVEWKNNVTAALKAYGSHLVLHLSNAELINWAIKCNFDGINNYDAADDRMSSFLKFSHNKLKAINFTVPDFVLNKLEDIIKAKRSKDVYNVYKKTANSTQRSKYVKKLTKNVYYKLYFQILWMIYLRRSSYCKASA